MNFFRMENPMRFDDFCMARATHFRHPNQMSDGENIAFMHGKQNPWAAGVYKLGQVDPFTNTLAVALPTDKYYFELLRYIVCNGGANPDIVWQLILWVYDKVEFDVSDAFAQQIGVLSWQHFTYCSEDVREAIHNVLMHLYYGFVAENYYVVRDEHNEPVLRNGHVIRTKYGPAIKLLGLSVLFETWDVKLAADSSRGNSGVGSEIARRGILLPGAMQRMGITCVDEDFWAMVEKMEQAVEDGWAELCRNAAERQTNP